MAAYLTPLLLCKEFARSVHCQHCYRLLQLMYLPISLIGIKGIQIEDHQIKIVNFADNTTLFLRDITRLNRINLPKAKPYLLEYIKI